VLLLLEVKVPLRVLLAFEQRRVLKLKAHNVRAFRKDIAESFPLKAGQGRESSLQVREVREFEGIIGFGRAFADLVREFSHESRDAAGDLYFRLACQIHQFFSPDGLHLVQLSQQVHCGACQCDLASLQNPFI